MPDMVKLQILPASNSQIKRRRGNYQSNLIYDMFNSFIDSPSRMDKSTISVAMLVFCMFSSEMVSCIYITATKNKTIMDFLHSNGFL